MPEPVRTAVVMTALDVEYAATREFLRDLHELVHPSGTVYEQGLFEGDGVNWQIALAQTGMGNAIAAIETARALHVFQPDVAVFVGVAG